jgi:hypothetical protein
MKEREQLSIQTKESLCKIIMGDGKVILYCLGGKKADE